MYTITRQKIGKSTRTVLIPICCQSGSLFISEYVMKKSSRTEVIRITYRYFFHKWLWQWALKQNSSLLKFFTSLSIFWTYFKCSSHIVLHDKWSFLKFKKYFVVFRVNNWFLAGINICLQDINFKRETHIWCLCLNKFDSLKILGNFRIASSVRWNQQ